MIASTFQGSVKVPALSGIGLTILCQPASLISSRLSYGSSTPNYGTLADDDGTLDPLDGFPRDPSAWFFDHAFHIGFRVPQATQFVRKSRFCPLHIPMSQESLNISSYIPLSAAPII